MFKALKGTRHARPFAPWRIVVWLVMLLSAVGFVINSAGAIAAAGAIGAMSPEALAAGGPDPRILMAWSVGYAVCAFAVMVLTLGTLRWREWGRRAMRIVAGVLAIWAIYTAWVAFHQWQEIGVVLGQAGLPPELLVRAVKTRSILLVGVVLKAVSVPVLAWLAWALGSVSVRQQFAETAL
jgi:hypothetical protein